MPGMEGTCPASTCRSGSDMVITNPRIKPRTTITHSLLLLVMVLPTLSPMGVMESSAPRVKNIMPTISSTPPARNSSRIPGGTGATLKHKKSTIPITGRTALNASSSFS